MWVAVQRTGAEIIISSFLPEHNHPALSSHSHICQAVSSEVFHPMDGASKPSNS